jgi:hypothetical protein
LHNNTWIRALRGKINDATQLEEFISIWIRIQEVQLVPDIEDSIAWQWTTNGKYTTKSAYQIQFRGRLDLLFGGIEIYLIN